MEHSPRPRWTLFRSPALDELVKSALERNPTLQGAQAALRQANETIAAQRGAYFPDLQGNYSFSRQRNATGTLSPTLTSGSPEFGLHTAQVSVNYLLDVLGVNRPRWNRLRRSPTHNVTSSKRPSWLSSGICWQRLRADFRAGSHRRRSSSRISRSLRTFPSPCLQNS